MPYKSDARIRDRDRKRATRKANQQSNEPPDFTRWFQARVNAIESVNGGRWEARLAAKCLGGEIDERTLARHYAGASKRPWAPTAYDLGWALHDIGIEWCSGPVVLVAAGYHQEFFRLLGFVATQGLEARCAALRFAFACDCAGAGLATFYDDVVLNEDRLAQVPYEDRPELFARRAVLLEREEQRQINARNHLMDAAMLRDVINESWTKSRERQTLIDVPESFQLAHDVISSTKCMKSVRYDGSLAILSSFTKMHGTLAEQELVQELILLSPIRTIDDVANGLLRNDEFMTSKTKEHMDKAYLRDHGSDQ